MKLRNLSLLTMTATLALTAASTRRRPPLVRRRGHRLPQLPLLPPLPDLRRAAAGGLLRTAARDLRRAAAGRGRAHGAAAAPAPSSNYELPPPRRLEEAQLMSYQSQIGQLTNPDERVRLDAVSQLGKTKSPKAVDPLAATLAGDPSANVRDAAAKALGIIGSPNAMPALRRAAQQDGSDHVRRTAKFSIEIIQSRVRSAKRATTPKALRRIARRVATRAGYPGSDAADQTINPNGVRVGRCGRPLRNPGGVEIHSWNDATQGGPLRGQPWAVPTQRLRGSSSAVSVGMRKN